MEGIGEFRRGQIQHCAEAALLPLIDGDKKALESILLTQRQTSLNILLQTWLKPAVEQGFARGHMDSETKAGFDIITNTAEFSEPLEQLKRAQEKDPSAIPVSTLCADLASGFILAENLIDIDHNPAYKRHLEKLIAGIRQSALASRNTASPDFRKTIETSVKWLDTAEFIANSKEFISSTDAFNQISLQK